MHMHISPKHHLPPQELRHCRVILYIALYIRDLKVVDIKVANKIAQQVKALAAVSETRIQSPGPTL